MKNAAVRMSHKVTVWALVFTMILTLSIGIQPQKAEAVGEFASGSGAAYDPFIITTAQELQNINLFLGLANKPSILNWAMILI